MDVHIVILDYYHRIFSAFRTFDFNTFVPGSPLQSLRPQFGHIAYFILNLLFSSAYRVSFIGCIVMVENSDYTDR